MSPDQAPDQTQDQTPDQAPDQARTGEGRLILITGPSGAGKDTVMGLAAKALTGRGDVVFARRIVTRPSSQWEDHESLTEDEFHRLREADGFALHWRAHGLCYALAGSVREDLKAGKVVVANTSRSMIEEARATFPHVTAVLITAPPEVLAERLARRNRETIGESRAPRPFTGTPARMDVTIDNVCDPHRAAEALLRVITGI